MESLFLQKIKACQEDNEHFKVQTLEWVEQNCPFQNEKPYRIPFFEIIWVKDGSGYVTIDLKKYKIRADTIYCIAPGELRQLQSNVALKGYYISLSADLLHILESSVNFNLSSIQYGSGKNLPFIETDNETQQELEGLLFRMIEESENSYPMKSEILQGYLKIFMIYISRKMTLRIQESILDNDREIVRKFIALVKAHFTTKKFVSDYADDLCVSPNYLNFVIKKITGYPASYHIHQYIVLEAKRHATHTRLSMKEVADFSGFEDAAHFSKFFKNYSGVNFSNYKKGLNVLI